MPPSFVVAPPDKGFDNPMPGEAFLLDKAVTERLDQDLVPAPNCYVGLCDYRYEGSGRRVVNGWDFLFVGVFKYVEDE